MVTYRHPSNMMLISFFHNPDKQNRCTVIAPTGPEISQDTTSKIATKLFGKPEAERWTFEEAEVGSKATPNSIVFRFLKKESK